LPKNMGMPTSHIQVLSPSRTRDTGTIALNRLLREAINPASPGKKEVQFGTVLFREGDKVMQVQNNYDIIWRKQDGTAGMGVFNGDIGTVLRIDAKASIMTIKYDDRLVDYTFDMLGALEPAFAMTVHKAQGSEYDAVILVACKSPSLLLNRRVLYTAITRARELMIILGSTAVIKQMVDNNKITSRFSGLTDRLSALYSDAAVGSAQ